MGKNACVYSKLSKQFFVILLVAFTVVLSACLLPPIVPEETSYRYTLDSGGKIIVEILQQGELVTEDELGVFDIDYENWQQNCNKKLAETLLSGIEEDKNALKDANAEIAEIIKRRIAIATFILDENLASCKFEADVDRNLAKMEIHSVLDVNVLKKFREKYGISEGLISIEIDENYIHTVRIPVDKNAGIKYIYLRAEGKIKDIKPKVYVLWGNYYRFRVDKLPEDINEIVVEYLPYKFKRLLEERKNKTPTPKETAVQRNNQSKKPATKATKTSKTKDLNTTNIAGIEIPTDPNTLLIILLGALGLIGLIVVIVIIIVGARKPAKPKAKKKKEEKHGAKEAAEVKKEKEKGKKIEIPTDRSIVPESEDIVIETRKRISEAKKIAKRFSLEEEKLIERTVEALKSKKDKYTKEQLKKVMISMGYREEIAEEVLRRLYE